MPVQKGTLQKLADELFLLGEEYKDLPYQENSFVAIDWRYKRLMWQDKLNHAILIELTRIANAMEARNSMVADMLLVEGQIDSLPGHEEEFKPTQEDMYE